MECQDRVMTLLAHLAEEQGGLGFPRAEFGGEVMRGAFGLARQDETHGDFELSIRPEDLGDFPELSSAVYREAPTPMGLECFGNLGPRLDRNSRPAFRA
jgi:hypothetical protein